MNKRTVKSLSTNPSSRTSLEPLKTAAARNNARLSSTSSQHRFGNTGRPSFSKPTNVTGQQVRSSSQFGRHGRVEFKDPRPIMDKLFQRKSVEDLIRYLNVSGYPHAISPKILHLPQTKEFVKIFEFLIGRLMPEVALPRKFDDYIVKLFKEIGYPFSITKSYFTNVGSPHAWPHVLAALHWLYGCIEMYETTTKDEIDLIYPQDEFDASPLERLRFLTLAEMYQAFLEEEEDLTDIQLEDYSQKLIKLSENGADLETLKEMNRNLTDEVNALLEQRDGLQEQHQIEVQRKLVLDADYRKFADYLGNLEAHTDKMVKKIELANQQLAALDSENAAFIDEEASLRSAIEGQELSRADVERMLAAQATLQSQVTSGQAHLEAIYKDIWAEQIRVAKYDDKITSQLNEYNERARHVMATDLAGRDINIEVKDTSDARRFDNVIKPVLMEIKQMKEGEAQRAERNLRELRDATDQAKEIVAQKESALQTLESQHKRLLHEMECSKEVWKKKEDVLTAEVEELSTHAITSEHQKELDKIHMEVKLKELKKQWEEKLVAKKEELVASKEATKDTAVMATQHKSKLLAAIDEYNAEIARDTQRIQLEYRDIMRSLGVPASIDCPAPSDAVPQVDAGYRNTDVAANC